MLFPAVAAPPTASLVRYGATQDAALKWVERRKWKSVAPLRRLDAIASRWLTQGARRAQPWVQTECRPLARAAPEGPHQAQPNLRELQESRSFCGPTMLRYAATGTRGPSRDVETVHCWQHQHRSAAVLLALLKELVRFYYRCFD